MVDLTEFQKCAIQLQIFQITHWIFLFTWCCISEKPSHFDFVMGVAETEMKVWDCICLQLMEEISNKHIWKWDCTKITLLHNFIVLLQTNWWYWVWSNLERKNSVCNMACLYINAELLVNSEIICETVEGNSCSPLWGEEMTFTIIWQWVAVLRLTGTASKWYGN